MTETLLTVDDVATFLAVPVATVYAWNTRGTGPHRMRVGKHVRYRRIDVDAWLDRQAAEVTCR
jgi:excisionase family DNA binding protein